MYQSNNMTEKPKTIVDTYLENLKNNRFVAAIIVVAIVLMAIAKFAGELTNITTFVSGFTGNEKSFSIEYLIENETNETVQIERFSDFYLISFG
jgi:hypothetical protein